MTTATTAQLTPQMKMSAARLAAVRRCPYFTQALMALVPREAPGLGTMGVTERLVLLWDPAAVERWTVSECTAVLVHEVGHVLRDHAGRCRAMGADHAKFNLAGDAEINDDIKAMGLELPSGCVYPETLDQPEGLTAEEYYRGLPPDPPTPDKPGAGQGWCGGGAGHAVPNEPDTDDPAGRSAQEVRAIAQQTAEAVKAHAARAQGSVPDGLQRWANATLKPPKVRWQDKLARAARGAVAYKSGAVDYRYSRPSRRQAAVGYGPGRPVLPALVAPVPRVMVAIDTSGSMGAAELERGVAEVAGILAAVGAAVDFVACDAQVHADAKAHSWRDIVRLCKGGGGTDFRPVFAVAAQKRPAPEVLVFVTDGQGPAPAAAPRRLKVIWLLVGPYRSVPSCVVGDRWESVAFGELVYVDDDVPGASS